MLDQLHVFAVYLALSLLTWKANLCECVCETSFYSLVGKLEEEYKNDQCARVSDRAPLSDVFAQAYMSIRCRRSASIVMLFPLEHHLLPAMLFRHKRQNN